MNPQYRRGIRLMDTSLNMELLDKGIGIIMDMILRELVASHLYCKTAKAQWPTQVVFLRC